jgi:hypothetical protein
MTLLVRHPTGAIAQNGHWLWQKAGRPTMLPGGVRPRDGFLRSERAAV